MKPIDRPLRLDVGAGALSDRLRVWERSSCDRIRETDSDDLRGQIDGRVVDRGSVARAILSRQTSLRTPVVVQQSNAALALVAHITGGTIVLSQAGRSWILNEGDLCIIDGGRPYEATIVSEVVKHRVLLLPKSEIARLEGGRFDLALGCYSATAPLQMLVTTFLKGIVGTLDELDTQTLNALLDQLAGLLALMVAHGRQFKADPSTHRSGLLARVKAFIAAHLRDDDLGIERAARALGISSRYINSLMASDGTSFGRYVLAQRLEGARREIMDPRRRHEQVTEVAFGWGFNSASHFGRVYKDRYGVTPREAKMAAARP